MSLNPFQSHSSGSTASSAGVEHSENSDLSASDPNTDANSSSDVLSRLVAEWRATRIKLGIPTSATVMDTANRLSIDRGTAQRLNQIAKLPEVSPADLANFPGTRAWRQVLSGVEAVLGADHPNFQRLSLASDHFSQWLNNVGGSRSAAMRHVSAAAAPAPVATPIVSEQESARVRAVKAAMEIFGYGVETHYNLNLVKESDPGPTRRIDLATVYALRGCRGKPGCMPLAFTRVGYTFDHKEIEGSSANDARQFFVLRSLTSKPVPAVLSTGDATRQTIFVEPQWSSLTEPLSLAVMHHEKAAMSLPWGTPHEWLEFSSINKHPCHRMVLERMISRDIESKCAAALRVFRSHSMLAHDEPWFDRIPDDTPVVRIGTPAQAMQSSPFSEYSELVSEAIARLKWDANDLIVYRTVIENPIPLATYTVMFDKVND